MPPALKIVLIGDTNVGKTSLIDKWFLDDVSDKKSPTVGAFTYKKHVKLDERELDLVIWDTAGQDTFRNLVPMYIKAAAAIILCVAINDQNSFENIPEWLSFVADNIYPIPPLILCVTKIDLAGEDINRQEIEEQYINDFKAVFFTSAVQGIDVDLLFMEAARIGSGSTDPLPAAPEPVLKPANGDKSKCC